ncbi:hypothetical protein WMY93_026262 [Mugilogobius chulae]|uniref:Uncharacterized protein n=1 Tax=Mugilogobius chulae TaxID=88201 RepID=A0AAW0N1S4_9GOBI
MGDIKSNMSKLLYDSPSVDRGLNLEAGTGGPRLSVDEDSKSEFILDPPKPKPPAWYHGLLTWDDFQHVNPHRASFLF